MLQFGRFFVAVAVLVAAIFAQPIASFENCPPGPITSASCAPVEPWAVNGGTVTVVPYGAITVGPNFPVAGTQWVIVSSATASGSFTQPAGGPALLPYAAGATGQIRIPIVIPTPPPSTGIGIRFAYTYVSPECPNDATYNDCVSVDLTTAAGASQLNLLYLDTFSTTMAAPAVSPNQAGTITASFCATPGTREAATPGAAKQVTTTIPPSLYGQNAFFEVNVADGFDAAFNSWIYVDAIEFVAVCGGGTPIVQVSQPGGAGQPILVQNDCLVFGNEYYNIVSLDLCPGGAGTGSIYGMCFTDLNSLWAQLSFPLNTPPFHFIALQSTITFGPYALPPIVFDLICVDVTGAAVQTTSAVHRATVL